MIWYGLWIAALIMLPTYVYYKEKDKTYGRPALDIVFTVFMTLFVGVLLATLISGSFSGPVGETATYSDAIPISEFSVGGESAFYGEAKVQDDGNSEDSYYWYEGDMDNIVVYDADDVEIVETNDDAHVKYVDYHSNMRWLTGFDGINYGTDVVIYVPED